MKHTNGNGAGADDRQGDAVQRSYNTLLKLHRTAVLAGDRMACIALAAEADPWTLPGFFFRFDGGGQAAAGGGDPHRRRYGGHRV